MTSATEMRIANDAFDMHRMHEANSGLVERQDIGTKK